MDNDEERPEVYTLVYYVWKPEQPGVTGYPDKMAFKAKTMTTILERYAHVSRLHDFVGIVGIMNKFGSPYSEWL